MSDKYLKDIAKELRLIRLEREQMNGVQVTEGGPKINIKALTRAAERTKGQGVTIL